MPEEGVNLLPRQEILDFEELTRLTSVFAALGVRRLRLTGGEPTLRKNLPELCSMLRAVSGIDEIVMTTNGHRLPELAEELARAGLAGVNVSLDTLRPERFRRLTRRGDLDRVLSGIEAAQRAGLGVKINAVVLRGENDDELFDLAHFAWERQITPRFIEHMPMSEGKVYSEQSHVGAEEIRSAIAVACGQRGETLVAEGHRSGSGPARYWRLSGSGRRFGIISAMSEHFCDTCNRVRLSAVGELHACLAYDDATNLRNIIRSGGSDADLETAIRAAVGAKRDGHVFLLSGQGGPKKHMISIGG
jgi:cyclic pyranopterin phosphate synthase